MDPILDTNLKIMRSERGSAFYAEAQAKPPPMGVTVVGIGPTIEHALTDLAHHLGRALDPDTED